MLGNSDLKNCLFLASVGASWNVLVVGLNCVEVISLQAFSKRYSNCLEF